VPFADGMAARHYQELDCWQLAHELKCEVFAFTAKMPAKGDSDFSHDIRRSARSAPSNIAEGFGRETHRDFANFLAIARASLMETDNHLQVNRTGFVGGLIPREDQAHGPTKQVLPRAA
jgi:four helix bundle protein